MKFCPECGKQLEGSAGFCGGCGSKLVTHDASSPSDSSKKKSLVIFAVVVLVCMVGLSIWFFSSRPLSLEDYKEQSAAYWAEFFDAGIDLNSALLTASEENPPSGGFDEWDFPIRGDAELKGLYEIHYGLVRDTFDKKRDAINGLERLRTPTSLSEQEREDIEDLLKVLLEQIDANQAAINELEADVLPLLMTDDKFIFFDRKYEVLDVVWNGPFNQTFSSEEWWFSPTRQADSINRDAEYLGWNDVTHRYGREIMGAFDEDPLSFMQMLDLALVTPFNQFLNLRW